VTAQSAPDREARERPRKVCVVGNIDALLHKLQAPYYSALDFGRTWPENDGTTPFAAISA
jgi:hypothetical protein